MEKEGTAVVNTLMRSAFFQAARTVGIYVHCERLREVDTSAAVQRLVQGRAQQCFVPLVTDSQANMRLLHLDTLDGLKSVPPFDILEPEITYATGEPREDVLDLAVPLDLLVMPGLAFDRSGNRLGRGGGYYDKFISTYRQRVSDKGWPAPLLVALAFDCQLLRQVPAGPTDQRVDAIVTASEVVLCTERASKVLHDLKRGAS
ncbi:hypothetical protein WJX72_010099 [[Myrmecia] bisecta]|uniref:5-formyltetrahydrofolate cyclo-ligase n=1 Tax=[Myrmecia] bisecta TaxID=41462 RepID=A0AAW1P7B4_9CHLO